MSGKSCSVCGNEIGEDNRLGKCSLCAIGLAPSSPLARESGLVSNASGRTLSGSQCPNCEAELSMADISLKCCSICGEMFRPDAIESSVQIRRSASTVASHFRTFPENLG